MTLSELLKYLTDDELRTLFTSDEPQQYLDFQEVACEILQLIERNRQKQVEASPTMLALESELLKSLDEISLKEFYQNGNTTFVDSDGKQVPDPFHRWIAYVSESSRWDRIIELAQTARRELVQ